MARAKQVSKRKRRGAVALPVLGAAGVSLAMAGGASATAPTANVPSQDTAPRPVITLGEEEISDVSLATFYVFDRENAGTSQLGQGLQLAAAAEAADAAAQHEAAEAAEAAAAPEAAAVEAAEAGGWEAAEAAAAEAADPAGDGRPWAGSLSANGKMRGRCYSVGRLPPLLDSSTFRLR